MGAVEKSQKIRPTSGNHPSPHHQKKCFPVGDLSRILVVLPHLSSSLKKNGTPLKLREFLDFLPYFSSKSISIAKSFLFLDRLSRNHLSFSSGKII
jgi:hypothetical protein